MAKAWLSQQAKQIREFLTERGTKPTTIDDYIATDPPDRKAEFPRLHGAVERNVPWLVMWYERQGGKWRRRSKSCPTKTLAIKVRDDKIQELITGKPKIERVTWKKLTAEYIKDRRARGKTEGYIRHVNSLVTRVDEIIEPEYVDEIDAAALRKFVEVRLADGLSDVTVDRQQDAIMTILRWAKNHKMLAELPYFEPLECEEHLHGFITEEHFELIYNACHAAEKPESNPEIWWKSLLLLLYTTGWRVTETMKLQWQDVDFKNKWVDIRARHTKSKRSERIALTDVMLDHLRQLRGRRINPEGLVFPFPHTNKTLYFHFHKIQDEAGVYNEMRTREKDSEEPLPYGFHDCRRAFATINQDNLDADELQQQMRHVSRETTMSYIQRAKKLRPDTADKTYVPNVAKQNGTA